MEFGSRKFTIPFAGDAGLHLVDLVCLTYLAVSAVAAFCFRARYPEWALTLPAHRLAMAAVDKLKKAAMASGSFIG